MPQSHVKAFFDAREQDVQAHAPIVTDPAEQARRIEAIEAIGELVVAYGTSTVLGWLHLVPMEARIVPYVEDFGPELVSKYIKFHAWRVGSPRHAMGLRQSLDRPTNRCLADGAVLVNHICVQCGRDNS